MCRIQDIFQAVPNLKKMRMIHSPGDSTYAVEELLEANGPNFMLVWATCKVESGLLLSRGNIHDGAHLMNDLDLTHECHADMCLQSDECGG